MSKTFFKGSVAGSYVKVKLNVDKLEDIQSALFSGFVTRVGILGNKTNRNMHVRAKQGHSGNRHIKYPSPMTNAELGLIHEKGSLNHRIPRRSFLEMPLVLKSEGLMAMKQKIWHAFMGGPDTVSRLKTAYRELGLAAERIIQRAFETRGFGRWQPDTAATARRKGSSAPLIDTGQLRRSITSDVVSK